MLSSKDLPAELQPVYRVLESFYVLNPDEQGLSHDSLVNLFFAGNVKDKQFYQGLFDTLKSVEASDYSVIELVKGLRRTKLQKDLALAAYDAAEGKEDKTQDLWQQLRTLDTQQSVEDEFEFVSTDIEELVAVRAASPSLKWRLNSLNKATGGLRKGTFGFVYARPECLAKGTEVVMADGRVKTIEQLREGMTVLGPDQKPRKILATTKGEAQLYRISYSWGDSFVVNDNHVLHLECYDGRIVNIPVIEYLKQSDKFKSDFKQVKSWLGGPDQSLACDPYILGLWLGDGHSAGPIFTNMDQSVFDSIQGYADENGLIMSLSDTPSQAKTIRLRAQIAGRGKNKFTQFLAAGGLLNNKHIPEKYLTASWKQRSELLAGLLDTDGSRGKFGYEITQVRENLAKQIVWLARSLGYHATSYPKTINEVVYHRVAIYGNVWEIPVRIEYKKFKNHGKKTKQNLRFGFTVSKESVGEYYGIYVDQDNLYVLGDFTVTHNTGKTTFLTDQFSFMAGQAEAPILHLNNEQEGDEVMFRYYQSALGWTMEQVYADLPRAKKLFNETTKENILLYDQGKIHWKQVERLLELKKPALMCIDQLDKIEGFDDDREDLRLGAIYQWTRELAKEYCPIAAVCQADGTAEGQRWLHMGMVANAKTAKQAEADWMLGIGRSNDSGYEKLRFLHLSKNKMQAQPGMDASMRHMKQEVVLEAEIGRYIDL